MKSTARINRNFTISLALALVVWTAALLISLLYHYYDSEREMIGIAHSQAAASIQKDFIYRRWASLHGGVYVPVTPQTPPNPHLAGVPEREITTPSGKRLTLMNPAYMTRQVHELAGESYENKGHITSTLPLNPNNGPDPWEEKALAELARGKKEYGEVISGEKGDTFRLMRPLYADSACLKCHGHQGYAVGDLRGGISTTVPLAPLAATMRGQVTSDGLRLGILWLLGAGTISGGAVMIRQRSRETLQTLEELEKSEERFRNLFDTMEEGFALQEIICDQEGRPTDYRFLEINPAFSRLTGLRQELVIGRRISEVIPDTDPYWLEPFGRVALTGEPAVLEEYSHSRGKWFRVVVYSPQPGQFAVLLTDSTEQRQLEEQLRQSQKMEAIGLLAGGVAHDFNNLLQVITTYGFLIQQQCREQGLPAQFVEEQLAAARRAAELTGALLTFSRKQTLNPKPVDLNRIVAESRKILKRVIGEDIAFEVLQSAEELVVCADEGEMLQVLMNLATNARDAMPRGGRLSVATCRTRPDPGLLARHGGVEDGDWVLLTVTDSGDGVAPENLPNIFEPFFTTKEPGKGTGLGLAIIYGIVRRHRGFIEVDSVPGKGSAFRIYLPLAREEDVAAKEPPAPLSAGSGVILLVEDEEAVRRALGAALAGSGYTVLEAADGEEGVRIFRERADAIDLVIIDMVMPRRNGRETLAEIRRIHPEVRSIFLSGYTPDILDRKGIGGEPGPMLRKPVEPGDLLGIVGKLLGKQGSYPEKGSAG